VLETQRYDSGLAALFGVPAAALPQIVACAGPLASTTLFGRALPITGMAGDQQAASIGQGCLRPGMVKCTYGTGIFMLAHAGSAVPASRHRLLATLASVLPGQPAAYALEGSIFVGGDAVKWLRDGLGILDTAACSEALAASVPDCAGVTFVPAFAGLGAPHWQPGATGLLTGITGGTSRAHIVRATLEAMGQQTADLLDAFVADGVVPATLKVDGGMVANNWLCQDIADATGLVVERPRCIETTAMGAAMLAAVGAGHFTTLDAAAAAMVAPDRRFEPAADAGSRAVRRGRWQRAIGQALAGLA
jgi:glycerol kinase